MSSWIRSALLSCFTSLLRATLRRPGAGSFYNLRGRTRPFAGLRPGAAGMPPALSACRGLGPLLLLAALLTSLAGAARAGVEEIPMAETGFQLTSDAFGPGTLIPRVYSGEGEDRSPPLRWSAPPEGTRSLALLVTDPDAPRGTFTHWVLFDIPAEVDALASGPVKLGVAGRNDFGKLGWGGPMPPRGHGEHRYVFTLYALDTKSLELPEGADRAQVERALESHVLGRAELIGRYRRD